MRERRREEEEGNVKKERSKKGSVPFWLFQSLHGHMQSHQLRFQEGVAFLPLLP